MLLNSQNYLKMIKYHRRIVTLLQIYYQFEMKQTPLWKRVNIHKNRIGSDKEKSFKKLDIPIKYQIHNFANQRNINKVQNVISKIIQVQDQTQFDRQQTIQNDPLFQNFLEQYKQINQQDGSQILVISRQFIQQDKKSECQDDEHLEQQKNSKNNLVQSLINKIRSGKNQLMQNEIFLQSIKRKVQNVRNINVAQLKVIIKEMFIVIKQNLSNLKSHFIKQKQRFLNKFIEEVTDYIQISKLLSKNHQSNGIQTSSTIQKLDNIHYQQNKKQSIIYKQIPSIMEKKGSNFQKQYRIKDLMKQNKNVKQQCEHLKQQLESKKLQLKQIREAIILYKNQISTDKIKNQGIQKKYKQQLKSKIEQIRNEMQQKNRKLIQELSQKNKTALQQLSQHYKKDKISSKQQINNLTSIIEQYKQQLLLKQKQIDVIKKKINKAQIMNLNQKIQKLTDLHKKRQKQLLSELEQVGGENLVLRSHSEILQDQISKITKAHQKDLDQLNNQNNLLHEKNYSLMKKIQSLSQEFQEKVNKARKKQRKQQKQRNDALEIQNGTLKEQNQNLMEKIKSLEKKLNQKVKSNIPEILNPYQNSITSNKLNQNIVSPKQKNPKFNEDYMYKPITITNNKNNKKFDNNQQIFKGIYNELGGTKQNKLIKQQDTYLRQTFNPSNYIQGQKRQTEKDLYKTRSTEKLKKQHKHMNTSPEYLNVVNIKSLQKNEFNLLQKQLSSLTNQLKNELQSVGKKKK